MIKIVKFGFCYSGPVLQEKAKEYAAALGINDFSASDGWLHRFKKRNHIDFRNVSGEEGSVETGSTEQWRAETLPTLLNGYKDDDIYNADESGLFFQMLPNRTMHFKGEKCTGGKQSKTRISVLFCVNKSGTHKLKPLVIGKSKKPRCFQNVKSLPVEYTNNTKAWMTSVIFLDFLRSFDLDLRKEDRKAVMLVDNCPSHPNPVPITLTNLKVHFLPKNTTSKLQPLDAGIISIFKRHYRKSLIRRLLHKIDVERNLEWKPNLLDAIHMTSYV